MSMKKWTPKSISGFVRLFLALFCVAPLVFVGVLYFIEANLGMHRAYSGIRAIEQETLIRGIQSYMRLQARGVQHSLEDLAEGIGRLSLWVKMTLADPEGFARLNRKPLMPIFEPETGQFLTPKSAEYSLRLPKGTRMNGGLATQALALETLAFALKDLCKAREDLCLAAYVLTPLGVDLAYPRTDFVSAVKRGLLKPETNTFRDIGYIKEALESQKPYTLTPAYQDFWGRGLIASLLIPIRDDSGKPLGVVGMDIRLDGLLGDAPRLGLGAVASGVFLVNGRLKRILDVQGFATQGEVGFVKSMLEQGRLSSMPREMHAQAKYFVGLEELPGMDAQMLVLFGQDEVQRLLSPIRAIFTKQREAIGATFGLSLILILGAAGLTGLWLVRRSKALSSHFEGQLKPIEQGDLTRRVAYDGLKEVERFVHTLNMTLDTIAEERHALANRNLELEDALKTIEGQKEAIVGLTTPILPVLKQTLLVPLIGALDSYRVHQLEDLLLNSVSQKRTKIVVLDMTGCPFMDTYTAKALQVITKALGLLGAKPFLVGIRPEVVRQMVGLGVELEGVEVAMTLEDALARITGQKA
jgi:anti-anti-sigma factor